MTETIRYGLELDSTHIPTTSTPGAALVPEAAEGAGAQAARSMGRSTVLPRVEWKGSKPDVVPLQRERFEEVKLLGQGGMGEVVLLKDHDIERMVALKRLPPGADLDRVLRFVEEIRTVGQLDHPNIVPVHDVGVDEQGRYYFLMKHLHGETLESIISRLKQGDKDTHARFSFRERVQVFLGVLNALKYAHSKGIIHRDLKPANIMVGPYGEVTLMDWGLARQVGSPTPSVPGVPQVSVEGGATARSLREAVSLQTQLGTVIGTPLYMAPEQARGEHDKVDARSDTYSLAVLFGEFLYLRHYLEGRETLVDVLEGVKTVEVTGPPEVTIPYQPVVPAELGYFVMKGLQKDPAKRYQSAEEMMMELQALLEGRIHVQCSRTMMKRMLHEGLHFADQHPRVLMSAFMGVAGLTLATVAFWVVKLLQ